MSEPVTPIFDGHNDALARLWAWGDDHGRTFLDPASPRPTAPPGRYGRRWPHDHIDLPRARAGGLAGGLFACFVPPRRGRPRAQRSALAAVLAQAAVLRRMERASNGAVRQCRSAAEVEAAAPALAVVLHLEGACAIDPGLAALEVAARPPGCDRWA